jgi:sulfopyruvate decarboxylase TPP-binding subunit
MHDPDAAQERVRLTKAAAINAVAELLEVAALPVLLLLGNRGFPTESLQRHSQFS